MVLLIWKNLSPRIDMVGTPFAANIFSLLNQNSCCIFQRKIKSRAHRNYTIFGRCTAVRVSVISMRPAIRWRFFILRRLAAGAPLCSVQQGLIKWLHSNRTDVLLSIAKISFLKILPPENQPRPVLLYRETDLITCFTAQSLFFVYCSANAYAPLWSSLSIFRWKQQKA